MPVVRLDGIEPVTGSNYPDPFNLGEGHYHAWQLSDAGGLTQFGAYIETLEPGAMTSQRHWHTSEDEFLYLLEGEVTIVEDDGPTTVRPGDAVCWPAGAANGHTVRNESHRPATYLIVGTRAQDDVCHYSDIDLVYVRKGGVSQFTHRDGTPYPPRTSGA
jgi:uncharacterized cupin superfamily protein